MYGPKVHLAVPRKHEGESEAVGRYTFGRPLGVDAEVHGPLAALQE